MRTFGKSYYGYKSYKKSLMESGLVCQNVKRK